MGEVRVVKEYLSKDDIYRDYAIAIRLHLAQSIHPSKYEDIPDLARGASVMITKYSKWVANFRQEYPLSVGFCVEVPLTGDTGQMYDAKMVVLGHETGPEFFVQAAEAALLSAGVWAGAKTADVVFDEVIKPPLVKALRLFGAQFYGTSIDRVEIRTANKGVLTLPWSAFSLDQVKCVVWNFAHCERLDHLVPDCFAAVKSKVQYRPSI